jgi:hypothetical protein
VTKVTVDALPKVVGFLRVIPPTGNVERVGWKTGQVHKKNFYGFDKEKAVLT